MGTIVLSYDSYVKTVTIKSRKSIVWVYSFSAW